MQLLAHRPGGLALMDPFPVALLGLSNFINSWHRQSDIVFQSNSMVDIYEKLLYQPVAVLLTELYSYHESLDEVRERILSLSAQLSSLKIIVYTHCQESEALSPLLDNPAISLISRNEDLQRVRELISYALSGQRVISPMMHGYLAQKNADTSINLQRLTRSECAILAYLFNGKTLQEIAVLKHCSIKTISTHKCSAMRKLQVKNNSELFSLKKQLGRDLAIYNLAI
ncbi:LuxR C-terminal-related transcriptional regulator [Kalamiella sp. sgz302252]|uniref:response regulator transcription factor n=1 Tax=Pantoea sp. sgz302252 TaxID=3341827 RepID=UPI0036D3BD4C